MELPTSSRELAGKVAVTVLTAAAILVVLAALWFGRSLALLAFAGLLLAILLRAVTNFLKRVSGLPDGLALAVTVLLFVGGAAGALMLLAPNMEAQAQSLWKQLPDTLDQARSQLSHHSWGQRLLAITPSANGILSRGSQLTRRSAEAIFGVLGVIGDAVVIAFIGLYFAINPRRYTSGAIALFPAPWKPAISDTIAAAAHDLRRWLVGKICLMAFVGVSTATGLFLLHIPLLGPLALLSALLDFIPNIGPVISAVPAVLLALTLGPMHAVWVIALYLGVQLVESYVLQPLVQGKAVSLPPAVLISGQVLFGLLLGLPGLFLATPLTVVFLVLVKRLYIGHLLESAPGEAGDSKCP